jgi:DNA-directed RNA polymerase II subunit RPB2
MQATIKGDDARQLAKQILASYFKTSDYPFTSHHINSYDQFLSEGIPSILRARNPLLILKDLQPNGTYKYRVELYVGGEDGRGVYVGTPTVSLQESDEVRLLFPNEARLRNLSYTSNILVDVLLRITIQSADEKGVLQPNTHEIRLVKDGDMDERISLCRMPIMLHSRYCILHNKPASFLREAGESEYDYGGYFVIEGAEKVLVTRQEQAFNTLYISNQERDPKIKQYATLSSLSPTTRLVKRVTFFVNRVSETIHVSLPFVRKPVPLFILFRAMGVQSDEDIFRLIFPDPDSAEAKILSPLLVPSISEALPFVDT